MHANEAFDSITAPIRGARRGPLVRAVFRQVTTFHVGGDGPAVCATVLALIHCLSVDIKVSASDGTLAVGFTPGLWRRSLGRKTSIHANVLDT